MEGQSDVYILAADGGTPRRVTTMAGASSSRPTWSVDGRWIYFSCDRSGHQEVWKIRTVGGEAVQVTRNGGAAPLMSPDGRFLYYVKDPAPPGIFRMAVEGGEERQVVTQAVAWDRFGVTAKGLYFAVDRTIQFLDAATGRLSTIAVMDKPLAGSAGGLCASPDDRFVLCTQLEQTISDLMLVEGFR